MLDNLPHLNGDPLWSIIDQLGKIPATIKWILSLVFIAMNPEKPQ